MKVRCHVVADDLTGACDTAAAFARHGMVSALTLEGTPPECEVAAWSTATRNEDGVRAYRVVRDLCERTGTAGAELFYKKIDSVLRGPVIAEIRACIDAGARTPAIVCPAFPAQGRVVRGGRLIAPGVDLDLREMLAGLPVEVRDAESSADLAAIAREIVRPDAPMAAGSAGLARELAPLLGGSPRAVPRWKPGRGRVLLFTGSDHPVTSAQIDALAASDRDGYQHWRIAFHGHPPVEADLQRLRTGGLFFCGGDTAAYLCRAFGVRALLIEDEFAPGVPVTRISGGPAHGLAAITKSGGFGEPDMLVRVVDALSGMRRKRL